MRSERPVLILSTILVIVTLAAAALAALAFVRLDNERRDAEKLRTEAALLAQQVRPLEETVEFLRERLGYPSGTSAESLKQQVHEDLAKLAVDLDADDFRSILRRLASDVEQMREKSRRFEKENESLKGKILNLQKEHQAEVDVHREARRESEKELAQEVQRTRTNFQQLNDQVSFLLNRLEFTTQRLRDAYYQSEEDRGKFDKKINSLLSTVRSLRMSRRPSITLDHDRPDGKVVYVDGRDNIVSLNLGRTHGVKPGMTFTVFRPDAYGRPERNIAHVEVRRINEDTCQAVVTKNALTDPIIPGDLVFNPILRENRVEKFALAGKLDVDGDGDDDTAELVRIIENQGGKVCLRVDSEGRVKGAFSIATKYLIMDDIPIAADKKYIEQLSRLHRDAIDHGIPVISARRFADEIGYTTPPRRK